MAKTVIIGGVAGGMSAAARLRRLDEKANIVVLEKGDYVSYANCGLPYYIGGTITDRRKLMVQTVESFKSRFHVDVRTGSEALSIDRKNKTVSVKDLKTDKIYEEKYDKLILSPGAEPVRPDLPGIGHPKIFTLRSIPDTDRIKKFIDDTKPRRAIIVGAGYIGLEMAENLHGLGISVVLVEMARQVMNAIDFEMAAIIHRHLRDKKIGFHLGSAVRSFSDENGKVKALLADGTELTGDMAILSIGVKPDLRLAEGSGLEIGAAKGILVNEYMQTSDPDIYAVGDAVETVHPVTGKKMVLPLAGPANKQGRIAADNIAGGNKIKYNGTSGSAVAKVFDLTAGVTGATGKMLEAANIPFHSVIIHPNAHASYYPDSLQLSLKILFSPENGKILGAQAVGYDGVDKRLDVIATAMHSAGTVRDLVEIEHVYAPPFSSAKDPVNMAGYVAENVLDGIVRQTYWNEIGSLDKNSTVILDVRTPEEVRLGAIPGMVNIPIDSLRERISELPKNKKIVVYCRVGIRGYLGARILTQNGFNDVTNLSGGYTTYSAAANPQQNTGNFDESYDMGTQKNK